METSADLIDDAADDFANAGSAKGFEDEHRPADGAVSPARADLRGTSRQIELSRTTRTSCNAKGVSFQSWVQINAILAKPRQARHRGRAARAPLDIGRRSDDFMPMDIGSRRTVERVGELDFRRLTGAAPELDGRPTVPARVSPARGCELPRRRELDLRLARRHEFGAEFQALSFRSSPAPKSAATASAAAAPTWIRVVIKPAAWAGRGSAASAARAAHPQCVRERRHVLLVHAAIRAAREVRRRASPLELRKLAVERDARSAPVRGRRRATGPVS